MEGSSPTPPAAAVSSGNNSGEDKDCCVKVAVHIRPLIGDERLQGCKDCVSVVPGKPQVPSHC